MAIQFHAVLCLGAQLKGMVIFMKKIKIIAFFILCCSLGCFSNTTYAMYTGVTPTSMPRREDVGTQVIETERLVLRHFRAEDAQSVFANWANNPENILHLTWSAHQSLSVTENLLSSWIRDYSEKTTYRWCITLRGSDIPIGGIDVTEIFDDRTCEIGFVLSRNFWNRGIMTEAARAVIDYLLNVAGFENIVAYHHVDNPASGRVLEKIGMEHVYTLKNGAETNDGRLVDARVYSISRNHR